MGGKKKETKDGEKTKTIKPIEPVDPIEPFEPIGGMLSGNEETGAADGSFEVAAAAGRSRKRRKISIYDATPDNDIRFRGIISYRHLRIMGWVCLALTVISFFIEAGMKLSPDWAKKYGTLDIFLSIFGQFAVFLFLFANMAVIIDKKSSYKTLFIQYGGLTIGFVLLFVIVYYRYMYGFVKAIGKATGAKVSSNDLLDGGFKCFNVFLDLLLCTAIFFFTDYRPKKWFTGKKIYIFRSFIIFPILYEVACILIKYYAVTENYTLHPMVSPFLTTKPVMCFLLFLRMAFYIKGRETKFLKRGKTIEEYNVFLRTKKNSFQFAKKFALMTVIYGVLDYLFVAVMMALRLLNEGLMDAFNQMGDEEAGILTINLVEQAGEIGFGSSIIMILFAPFILFFSYTKSYRKSYVDILIPVIAVAVIALIILEGLFQIGCLVPSKFSFVFEFLQ